MPSFQTKRYEQILMQMLARVVTRSRLSDISDSSVVKHVLAAAARQDDEQYFQMSLLLDLFSIDTAAGEDLDRRAAEIQPGTISRSQGAKAVGNIVFYRTGTTGTVTISAGTRVKTSTGIIFITTAAGSITPTSPEQISGHGIGRDSGLVPVIAEQIGVVGNVASDTIVKFEAKPAGVEGVTNPAPCAYGTDLESDDSFRERIINYIAALPRSTVNAIESGVLNAVDSTTGATILYARVIEDSVYLGKVMLYVDAGTGSAESSAAITGEILTEGLSPGDVAVGGETTLFFVHKPIKSSIVPTITSTLRGALTGGSTYDVTYDFWYNPASGQIYFPSPGLTAGEKLTSNYTYYTGIIALAQKIVDGDETDRANYPGIRAAGVQVICRVPQVLIQEIEVVVAISAGYDDDTVRVEVEEKLLSYINTLGISTDVLRSELIYQIMSVPGVYNCFLEVPSADVIILDDQVVRTTSANIDVR